MDIPTLIISIIAVFILIGPFIASIYFQNRKKNHLIKTIQKQSEEMNSKVVQFELCGNKVIGLDENSSSLSFFKKLPNGNSIFKSAELQHFRSCELINKTNVYQGGSHNMLVKKLELKFVYRDQSKENLIFEIFDSDVDLQIGDDLQFCKKWVSLINEKIRKD